MPQQDYYKQRMYILFLLLSLSSVSCFIVCPSSTLINSLSLPHIHGSGRNITACDCIQIEEGGWEITCYTDESHDTTHVPDDYPDIQTNSFPIAFIIRYEIDRHVEIMCEKSYPRFRPALFQGFGIETIDTFRFINCPLPSLPFSVILHRASPTNLKNRSPQMNKDDVSSSSVSPEVSKVRYLVIKSPVTVTASQLNRLFSGLETIEQIRLLNLELEINAVNFTVPTVVDNNNNNNNSTEYNSTSDVMPQIAIPSENIFNFGQNFPNLKVLRLQSFITGSVPGVLSLMLRGLSNIEYLELDSNNLTALTKYTFSSAKNTLKKLYMYGNTINELDPLTFSNLSRLEILDISNNDILELPENLFKDLSNLKHLSVKGNKLIKLPEMLFKDNANLRTLDIALNRNLTDLPVNLFMGLDRLSNFSAKDCQLSYLSQRPELLFKNAPNLEIVELRGNKLRNLTVPGLFGYNHRLTKLDLSYNEIISINKDIFNINSSHILELNLYGNELTSLPDNVFFLLRNLQKLNLGFNSLRETSHNLFLSLQSLEELDLSKNQIMTLNTKQNLIPFGLGPNLRRVNLSYNNLTDFDSEFNLINWSLYLKITEIDLRSNKFAGVLRVPSFSGSTAPTIDIDLSNNYFSSIDVTDLMNRDELALQIDNDNKPFNRYDNQKRASSIQTNTWQTNVRIDRNPFNCDCTLESFLRYAKLNRGASPSRLTETTYRQTVFLIDTRWDVECAIPDKLTHVKLIDLQLYQLVCGINDSKICPESCDCFYRSSDRSAIIDCDNRALQSLPKKWELTNFLNISLSSNLKVNKLNGVILQLTRNNIQSIDHLKQLFIVKNDTKRNIHVPSYVEINLDYNNISSIPNDFFVHSDPLNQSLNTLNITYLPMIKLLSLKHNKISSLPMSFLKQYPLYTQSDQIKENSIQPYSPKLYLGSNPYNCTDNNGFDSDCHMREFKSWLTRNHENIGDINDITCSVVNYNSSYIIVEIPDDILCPSPKLAQNDPLMLTLTIIIVVLAISLFIVSVLYYRNKQTVLAFIYIHFNPIFICLSFIEDDLDEDKIYDAFVSYSSADRDIVMQLIDKLERPNNEANLILHHTTGASIHEGISDQIVPVNEFKKSQLSLSIGNTSLDNNSVEHNENYFKLCIHERDWVPGNLISWNIINSVKNSKRTILVLSKDFIKSIWFQVEFHTAYYQMLEDKIDRLIVIVKGQLPPKEELDKDLVFLLTTKTYLVWGEKWFWEKLRYALPHKKHKVSDIKSHTNSRSTNNTFNLTPAKNGVSGKSSETMKDYVDKTIANHFQLNVSSSPSAKSAPISLRNSGSNITGKSPAPKSTLKSGHNNQSFVVETRT